MKTLIKRCALLFLLLPWAGIQAQELVEGEHVDAQLVAETETAYPGQQLTVALRLVHMEGWHTYWRNPGDAGKPTEIDWQLPDGVSAGDILWPTPQRIELPADLVDFGYEGELFLLTRLTIPGDYDGSSLDVTADVQWLECEEICIPGGAMVSLSLPVASPEQASVNQRWAEDFERTREALPREDVEFDAMFSIMDGRINLLAQATEPVFEDAESIRFLPGQHRVFNYNAEQNISYQRSSVQITQAHHRSVADNPPERIEGLIVVTGEGGGETAYQVAAQPEGVDLSALEGVLPVASQGGSSGADISLWLVFVFALLGGVILNLMPCVFPVLSLKALSLTAGADKEHLHQKLHGIAYALGIIAAFLVLATVLLTLQAGGSAIGWGFHLQSPWFVGALIYLFFIMGLAMAGIVEIGAGIMGLGSSVFEEQTYRGSFFTGVLASVVASPCTAPFMGTALGFAFTQPMPVALTVFVALGFGMALPFLLFSFVPALARVLPRPGQWMVIFKQFLSFPLFATAVWLLWVLGRQAGTDAMALVIGSCVLLGFATWLYQRGREAGPFWRYANAVLILLCLIGAFAVLRSPFLATATGEQVAAGGTGGGEEAANVQAYSDARLQELRQAGRPVFVNMTASWCITCLVNERVALTGEVFEAMEAHDVAYLKGDWTNNDPEITAVLKRYNTSGVPLYLLYPPDPGEDARVLPQILSESLLLDAIENLGNS